MKFALPFLVLLAVGCTKDPSIALGGTTTSKTEASTNSEEVLIPHPVVPEQSAGVEPVKAVETKTEPVGENRGTSKIDPDVLGRYRFVMSDEQKQQIEDGIAKIRAQAESGNQSAAKALAMAEAVREAAKNLTVTLQKNGRFSADFGEGETGGTFKMYKNALVLTPDNKPDPKEDMPADVELVFDKASKKLTVDYQGQEMIFERDR